MQLSAAIITRFHYPQDDKRFEWRYEYYRDKVLPRILNQKYKNFDICVWCNPVHKKLFESLSPKIKTFWGEDKTRYKGRYFHDFIKFEQTKGLDKYNIQFGLDSDDLIDRRYISLFMERIIRIASRNPDKSIHLCYQPEVYILKTGKTESMLPYGVNRGSAFMALYQNTDDESKPYRFIYEGSHISIIRKADVRIILPRGHCWATVHDINESTGRR